MKIPIALLPLSLSALLVACGGGSSSSDATDGQFSLAITDGPVEAADAVVVTFTEVELKPAGGNAISLTLAAPVTINLLDYQGQVAQPLVSNATIPAGDYSWIRLGVDDSDAYIEIDGAQYPLEIPSSAQSGLKLNRGFTLAAGGNSDFVIDFDLRKSVHQEGTGDYKLRPTLRLIDNLSAGSISGSVADALILDEACVNNGDNNDIGNVVYLYTGSVQTPADITGNADTDPLASALVTYDDQTNSYGYSFGFVAAGDYTLAFTCDALIDDPLVDDELIFSAPVAVQVVADQDATADLL